VEHSIGVTIGQNGKPYQRIDVELGLNSLVLVLLGLYICRVSSYLQLAAAFRPSPGAAIDIDKKPSASVHTHLLILSLVGDRRNRGALKEFMTNPL
jgi:hypothetical protein